jgi:hypothetical protein
MWSMWWVVKLARNAENAEGTHMHVLKGLVYWTSYDYIMIDKLLL